MLGACNPQLTYRALQAEDKIGTMLPCNIVIQERPDHHVEISAVDPVTSLQAIPHIVIGQVAADIRSQLQSIIAELGEPEWGVLEVGEMQTLRDLTKKQNKIVISQPKKLRLAERRRAKKSMGKRPAEDRTMKCDSINERCILE